MFIFGNSCIITYCIFCSCWSSHLRRICLSACTYVGVCVWLCGCKCLSCSCNAFAPQPWHVEVFYKNKVKKTHAFEKIQLALLRSSCALCTACCSPFSQHHFHFSHWKVLLSFSRMCVRRVCESDLCLPLACAVISDGIYSCICKYDLYILRMYLYVYIIWYLHIHMYIVCIYPNCHSHTFINILFGAQIWKLAEISLRNKYEKVRGEANVLHFPKS